MKDEICEYERSRQDAYAPLVERVNPKWRDHQVFIHAISCGLGWRKILFQVMGDLDRIWDGFNGKKGRDNWTIIQAKEKFGALRFYVEHPDDASRVVQTFSAITRAERATLETCERCGEPGHHASQGGHIATVCDACEQRWKERRSQDVLDALFG